MSCSKIIAVSCAVVAHVISSASQTSPPKVFVDKDICPGEACSYEGRARVIKSTTAYAEPDESALPMYEFVADDVVTPFKSEVHTVAGRFVVKRAYENYQPGDVLWLYTYLGEGVFKVWYRGKMSQENLGFSPWGGSAGKRCEKHTFCWGELEKELDMTWWLKAKSVDGREGWIRVKKNLEWDR